MVRIVAISHIYVSLWYIFDIMYVVYSCKIFADCECMCDENTFMNIRSIIIIIQVIAMFWCHMNSGVLCIPWFNWICTKHFCKHHHHSSIHILMNSHSTYSRIIHIIRIFTIWSLDNIGLCYNVYDHSYNTYYYNINNDSIIYVTDVMSFVYSPTRDRETAVFLLFNFLIFNFYTDTYFFYWYTTVFFSLYPRPSISVNVIWPPII